MRYAVAEVYVRPKSQLIQVTCLWNLRFLCYLNMEFRVELMKI